MDKPKAICAKCKYSLYIYILCHSVSYKEYLCSIVAISKDYNYITGKVKITYGNCESYNRNGDCKNYVPAKGIEKIRKWFAKARALLWPRKLFTE